MRIRQLLGVTGLGLLLASCPASRPGPLQGPGGDDVGVVSDPAAEPADDIGLEFTLSEGRPVAAAVDRVKPAAATPLGAREVAALLARMPPLQPKAEDVQTFALRPATRPPPRVGATVLSAFPGPGKRKPPPVKPEAPRVLRHSPDGEVELAADLSITFSQPMVAMSSAAERAATTVPVVLRPQPPGEWVWVGTRTLMFRPQGRFPMATDYTVEVAPDAVSAAGVKLAEAPATIEFSTPAPQLIDSWPYGTTSRTPDIFLAFDQRIDPSAVVKSLRVTPKGGAAAALRMVTPAEIARDPGLRALTAAAGPDRWLLVRPSSPLPLATEITVQLAPGAPSAEGPRRTTRPQEFTFHTFAPLALRYRNCEDECWPDRPFELNFTNPIDGRKSRKSWVRVEPPIAGMEVFTDDDTLRIGGDLAPHTNYRVTIDGALRDVYGQTLGEPIVAQFATGAVRSELEAAGDAMTVLDPLAGGKYSVFTTGHTSLAVRVHAVTPADWHAYLAYRDARYEGEPTIKLPPGTPVRVETVKISGDPGVRTETRLDLAPAITDGLGHAIVVVEPTRKSNRWEDRPVTTWVQATRIGLDAFADGQQLTTFVSDLRDGKPLSAARLVLTPSGTQARSDADGLARLRLPKTADHALLATLGRDLAFLPNDAGVWAGDWGALTPSWRRQPKAADELLWHVFEDRGLYRPGETVRVKGWLRRERLGPGGGLGLPGAAAREIRYTLRDERGDQLATGKTTLGPLGGFDLTLSLPREPALGRATLSLEVSRGTMKRAEHALSFLIEEFRRPEFEVAAHTSEGPHFIGDHADLTVAAKYFTGAPLPGAAVEWSVSSSRAHFRPPGHDDYTFGTWRPWWLGLYSSWFGDEDRIRPRARSFHGTTDAVGEHHLRADFVRVSPSEPTSVYAEATVRDVNRQAWSARTGLIVHSAGVYVGMKSDRLFVRPGEPLEVDVLAVDIDGAPVRGRDILVRAARLDWEQQAGEYRQVEKDPQDCRQRSTDVAVRCSFLPKQGGTYKISASVRDEKGRENHSELTLWVEGGEQPPSRTLAQEKLTLIPDKREYAIGDTAKLLVLAPFSPAEGVVLVRRDGGVETRRLSLSKGSTTLELPIRDEHIPGFDVQVELVGAAVRTRDDGTPDPTLPRRPAQASGEISLAVPALSRELELSLRPGRSVLEPGASTPLEVVVRDALGRPVVGGEVAVVVVDEAVLALSGHDLGDPLATFFRWHDADLSALHSRADLVLANPEDTRAAKPTPRHEDGEMIDPSAPPAPGTEVRERAQELKRMVKDTAKRVRPSPKISLRSDFDALALFAASLPTDAQGRARVDIKLPGNLTRYRVMAMAVAGNDRFGTAETVLTARLPLMVRPSPPRFLNHGDRFELPVVVHNQTDAAMTVELAARTANLDLVQGAGRRVQVPAHDRVEVRLPAAAVHPGTARFQVAAASGAWSDAASGELPVWTPATTEAFATYGQIDAGGPVLQPVQPPRDAVPQFGGLELSTSSTAVAGLGDAVDYLVRYPFACNEQRASRLLTIVALKDVLAAFTAPNLPKPDELLAMVAADLERLRQLQNWQGGWGFWRGDERSWPYLSVHVTHALERAQRAGFAVSAYMLDEAHEYLREIEDHFTDEYSPATRRPIVAYALYVRHRLGDPDLARARRLYAEVKLTEHSPETLAWLLPVLGDSPESKAILRHLGNRVRETAGAAHFTTGYSTSDGHLLLHSERRVDGLLLDALIGADPQSDVIPKLVRGLLGHRAAGRWSTTQDNVFILLALGRYFAVFERDTPDFVARAWLGAQSAGEHTFKGRATEQHRVEVPMPALLKAGPQDLVLDKTGPGRLYYRVGMRYAPKSREIAAVDAGFVVERSYRAVDDEKDVRREPDGTWKIRAGAQVQVDLTMVARDRRYHVALVDPLPAGLEAVGSRSQGHRWYAHENLRDDRVEAFTSLLWSGVYTYSYLTRATTPGQFVVPPARAEEMYAPETFGRSAGDRVVVE